MQTNFIAPIQDLKSIVENDLSLKMNADRMFIEALQTKKETPIGSPSIKNFDEFLEVLNDIMTQAPEYCDEFNPMLGAFEPCGLVGFPINSILNWPMATEAGYDFFSNALINQQFKIILEYWAKYLSSEDSKKVLVEDHLDRKPRVLGWLNPDAQKEMIKVACQATDDESLLEKPFEYFFNANPEDKYYGYKSWDDFFTRTFVEGRRPIASTDNEIANACESAPLQLKTNVAKNAAFWLKEQEYSLETMMNFNPLHKEFIGGTVYQAFLSALSYHRWNSPVSGTVKEAYIVNGSYYLGNKHNENINRRADESAPNKSQPFLTSIATRAVIFIESDNPKIGLMCFIAVGMAEVSSCEITVKEGQHLEKGDELGMFHFGGSTHCLIFRPEVKLEFDFHNTKPGLDATNIPVCSRIATVLD
ncbi:MAG: phosphatidylserine decarboxylase family protein [Psittacicella sp.]